MRKRNYDLEVLLSAFFVLCICTFGMFYEFCGAIWTVILSVTAIVYFNKKKKVHIGLTVGLGVYLLFLAGYIITIPYAVDAGMAFLGVGRILWIAPFLLLFQQLRPEQKQRFFDKFPWYGCMFTVIGLASNLMPEVKDVIYVNHRLGGPFQYPNTFALFLLVGIIILLQDGENNRKNSVCFIVLCVGIAASGSRTVMLLSVAVMVVLTVKRKKWKLLVVFSLLCALGLGYIVVMKDTATIGRILRLSLSESTFVGRILYAQDALRLLIRHPFGMGHLGYYYTQNMIQSGMYTVRYVHNDWLQIGLDIGWIPMLAYLLAVARCVCDKKADLSKRWALAVVFLHGLLDFDLSYTVMLCLVFLLMDDIWLARKDGQQAKRYELRGAALAGGLALSAVLGIYIVIPTLADYCGNSALAVKMYPWYTEAGLKLISESYDIEEVELLAQRVLDQNDTCALAYYAKAYAAYYRDDYGRVIYYQREAIARDYFNYEEYLNYALMLYDGMVNAEEEAVREACRTELHRIPELLTEAEGRLSVLGKKIQDQPELTPDAQMKEILELSCD